MAAPSRLPLDPRPAEPAEVRFFEKVPGGHAVPLAALAIGLAFALIYVGVFTGHVAFNGPNERSSALTAAFAFAVAAQAAAYVWWVLLGHVNGLRVRRAPPSLRRLSGPYGGRTVLHVDHTSVAVPPHWMSYLVRDQDAVSVVTWPLARLQAAPWRVVELRRLDPSPGGLVLPPLHLSMASEIPLGAADLLSYRPVRGAVVPLAVSALSTAIVLGPVAAFWDRDLAAAFWGAPGSALLGLAVVLAVPLAAWALRRHAAALNRIRRHYAETQGVQPLNVVERFQIRHAPNPLDLSDAPDLSEPAGATGGETTTRRSPDGPRGLSQSVTLAATPLPESEPVSRATRTEPRPLIERLEWEELACVAPGLARLRVVTTDAMREASPRVRAALSVRVVGEDGFDHTDPRFAPQNIVRLPLLPDGQTVHARVSETARIGARVWAVVSAEVDGPPGSALADHRESHRSPPLHVLGKAAFWIGPQWEHDSCAEGDEIRIGGAARGLPPGASVRVTITGETYGPDGHGDERSRSAEIDHFDAALDTDCAFSVTWTARHDRALLDKAVYLGWPEPTYRATVEVLGLVDMTGDLHLET